MTEKDNKKRKLTLEQVLAFSEEKDYLSDSEFAKLLNELTDEQIVNIRKILDVIAFKSESDDIIDSLDLLNKHFHLYRNILVVPYNHFPDGVTPYEINKIVQKLYDEFFVFHSVSFSSDSVNIRFPINGNTGFKNLKRIVDSFPIKTTKKNNGSNASSTDVDTYEISIRDREIRVNDNYTISKPHAVGGNMDFFLHIFNNHGKLIAIKELPEGIKNQMKGKKLFKITNALGFKGEILKAFFPKRSKTKFMFVKTVTDNDLANLGIEKDVFLQEIRSANEKYSSK